MALTKLKASGIADGAVTASGIATGAVTAVDIAANSITVSQLERAGTSGQLLTSAGTGADAAWSDPPAGGLSQYSIWVMDTTFTGSAEPMTNWTEASLVYERIGTVMGESSGVFTFPETGKWEVHLFANGSGATWPTNTGNSYHIQYSTNSGSSFSDVTRADRWGYGGQYEQTSSASMTLFDVTSTTTHLMRFRAYARTGTNITGGDGSQLRTYAVFKKIGAT